MTPESLTANAVGWSPPMRVHASLERQLDDGDGVACLVGGGLLGEAVEDRILTRVGDPGLREIPVRGVLHGALPVAGAGCVQLGDEVERRLGQRLGRIHGRGRLGRGRRGHVVEADVDVVLVALGRVGVVAGEVGRPPARRVGLADDLAVEDDVPDAEPDPVRPDPTGDLPAARPTLVGLPGGDHAVAGPVLARVVSGVGAPRQVGESLVELLDAGLHAGGPLAHRYADRHARGPLLGVGLLDFGVYVGAP